MANEDIDTKEMSFWDHLDELRGVIFHIFLAVVGLSVVFFCLKEAMFNVIFLPKNSNFITYHLFSFLSSSGVEDFSISLINTGLADQFMTHMKVSFICGLLFCSPYVIFEIFRFISPALYESERRVSLGICIWGSVMFYLGVAMNYFLVFPLTLRFLGTYQVSAEVVNMISLESYISTLILMSLALGIVFEIPVVCSLLARLGLLTPHLMIRYRRHAVVVILIAAAIITPTADAFTLFVVAVPMYLLYEFSILVVASTRKKRPQTDNNSEE